MAGAAYLCAGAAYRSGAGLVRILTPEENRVILQTLLPEAVMTTFEQNELEALDNTLEEALSWATVAAIGPGLGRKPWAYHMVKLTLQKFHGPLVIDADALNILSEHMEWLEQHEGDVILTPHVGEFSRLTGVESRKISEDISGWAAAFAREHHCICILKDAPSAAAMPDGTCYANTTGNSGMSTGGSGDVLTGILTGLFGSFWQCGANGLLQSAVSMAAAFLLTYPVFKIGALGGGDIKVFLVIGSFLPVRECLVIMAAAFLAGGVFSVGKLLAEKNGRERLYYFLSYVGEVARSGHFRIYGEDWKEDRVRYRKNKIHFTVPILIGAALRIGGLI